MFLKERTKKFSEERESDKADAPKVGKMEREDIVSLQ